MQILDVMNQGGPMMWVILAMSVFATAVSLERAVSLYLRSALKADQLVDAVVKHVAEDDFASALKLCSVSTQHPLPTVLKAGLSRADRPGREVEKAMEAQMLRALPKLQRGLGLLGLLGNVATLLGLLGTIFGLITAFSGVSAASASERQQVLAEGISIAMYTTAFGIVAAVPILFAHTMLVGRQDNILIQMEEGSVALLAALSGRSDARSRRPRNVA